MKINLRKAAAIQSEIRNYISSKQPSSSNTEVPLSFEEASKTVVISKEKLNKNIETIFKLYDILSVIRINVATANTLSGINALLTNESIVNQKLRLLEQFKSSKVAYSDTVLQSMIERYLTKDNNGYFSSGNSISIPFVDQEFLDFVDQEVTKHKRNKTKITESLLALNIQTEIEISEDDFKYLEDLGIV